ncbi:MAG TPA: hypothetical protein VFP32_01040 [Candidatus Saccharimonadales bacterium]|nr:hypothetical protein [Candidatus Saccharimonadales bacterium]
MTDRFEFDGPFGPSPEGQRFLDMEKPLAEVDWQHRAAVHADAWEATGEHEEFEALLGAAALAVKQMHTQKESEG